MGQLNRKNKTFIYQDMLIDLIYYVKCDVLPYTLEEKEY